MALPEIVARLAAGAPLPERTVAITIDDAALSVYREAWPRLKAAKLPFTLFVSTEPLDRGFTGSMSWAQLRSEEHTSELQSLMRISYAVFCLKKKTPHSKINVVRTTKQDTTRNTI